MSETSLSHHCLEAINEVSETILSFDPDPIPHYLILNELSRIAKRKAGLQAVMDARNNSHWVQELRAAQWEDGTWGRFHTQDTKVKQAIPTTETAISLALAYGLDMHDPTLAKTVTYIKNHLAGKVTWRDRPEKHDDPKLWRVLTPFISAANLALIEDEHPMLDDFINAWVEIVTAAFQSGIYNRQTEITIFNERLNLHTKNPPAFHTKYPLILLSSQRSQLDPQLERLILADVMSRSDGIYYLYSSLLSEMPAISDRKFYYWLETQKILARFPTWFRHADSFILDILAQRNAEGLWSFSKRVPRQPYSPLPISESWRKKANKSIDCSVLVLQLLSQYFQQAGNSAEA